MPGYSMFALFGRHLSSREKFIQSIRLNAGLELLMKPVEQMSSMVTVDFMLGLPGGAWASPLPDGGEGTSSPPSPCPEGANQGLAPAQDWLLVNLDSFPDSKKTSSGRSHKRTAFAV